MQQALEMLPLIYCDESASKILEVMLKSLMSMEKDERYKMCWQIVEDYSLLPRLLKLTKANSEFADVLLEAVLMKESQPNPPTS